VIVSINQPAYLPWLGYFDRISASDLHIVLDHVQFEKNSFINRNKVRTSDGWTWLTVPVLTKGRFGELPILSVEVDNTKPWPAKHWATIRQSYAKCPHFAEYGSFFEHIYSRTWPQLAELARETTEYIAREAFGITTPMRRSSEMNPAGAKSELILNLCKSVGATVYLSGPLGRGYLDEGRFAEAGISVRYHDYVHPKYPQRHAGFEPFMSAVDVLFNCGRDSKSLLGAPGGRLSSE
jgi:hypothetical protein